MKKLLLSLFCAAAALTAPAAEFTYVHTFAKGDVAQAGGKAELSGIDWTTTAVDYLGFDTSNYAKGIQLGSKNKPSNSWSIYTSAFSAATVKKVVVTGATASGGKADISVSVNDAAFGATQSVEMTVTECTFEGSASGELLIKFTNAGETALAMYCQSISVTYEADKEIGSGENPVEPPVVVADTVASLDVTFEGIINFSQLSGWTDKAVKGDKSWFLKTFNSNTSMACSGYNGTSTEGYEAWLITPAININKAEKKNFTFDSQAAYSGDDQLKVFVMNDPDPTKATLSELTATVATPPASGYSDWVNAGEISLADRSGIIYIGFRYTAPEGQTGYRTYCVDNIKLSYTPSGDEPVQPTETEGDGTEAKPYTVTDVLTLDNPGTTSWTKGYIVGYVKGSNMNACVFEVSDSIASNIVIAATANETDIAKCVPVALPSGEVRSALNLKDNPSLLGKEVSLYGELVKYMGVKGVKNVSKYQITGAAPVTYPTVADIEEWCDEMPSAYTTITGPVTVVYQNNLDLLIQDASGSLLVYGKIDAKFENGDVIKDITGKYNAFHNLMQFSPVAASFDQTPEKGAAVKPMTATLADVKSSNIAKYITLTGLDIKAVTADDKTTFFATDGTTEVEIYNRYAIDGLAAGTDATITGFVWLYDTKMEIVPTAVIVDASAIAEISADAAAPAAVFDLTGRRVANPGKGLYIVNGKKVIF